MVKFIYFPFSFQISRDSFVNESSITLAVSVQGDSVVTKLIRIIISVTIHPSAIHVKINDKKLSPSLFQFSNGFGVLTFNVLGKPDTGGVMKISFNFDEYGNFFIHKVILSLQPGPDGVYYLY